MFQRIRSDTLPPPNRLTLGRDNYNAQARTFWNAMKSSIISSKSDIVRPLKDLAADISGKYPHLNIESVSVLLKKGLFDLPPTCR